MYDQRHHIATPLHFGVHYERSYNDQQITYAISTQLFHKHYNTHCLNKKILIKVVKSFLL